MNYFSIEKGEDRVFSPMARVHGHGAPIYGVVDQSQPTILIWAVRILCKWRGIYDLILVIDLNTDGS
jgi:hypothetical protein